MDKHRRGVSKPGFVLDRVRVGARRNRRAKAGAVRAELTDIKALRKEVTRQKDMLTASARGNLGSFLSLRMALIQVLPKSAEYERTRGR